MGFVPRGMSVAPTTGMEVRFWGVRGSVATSGAGFVRHGGNTTCVEVRAAGWRLLFDAGTGIRALGEAMLKEDLRIPTAIFFTHLHWDHLQGFPFFGPAWDPRFKLHLFGPGEGGGERLEAALRAQMMPPGFPVTLEAMRATMYFGDAPPDRKLEPAPGLVIRSAALDHPNGCNGYRVEADGASFAFCTDVEVEPGTLPKSVVEFARGADLLAFDAQYTPEEYCGAHGPCRKGWGHSTMIDAARVADAAGVRRLLLTHHDPSHDDATVDAKVESARTVFAATDSAYEGLRVSLRGRRPWASLEESTTSEVSVH